MKKKKLPLIGDIFKHILYGYGIVVDIEERKILPRGSGTYELMRVSWIENKITDVAYTDFPRIPSPADGLTRMEDLR